MLVNFHFRKYIRSNPVNTDTEGAKKSIRINGVSVLSGSCYENKKDPFYRYKYTLGARAFSSAVSVFCQVFIVTRAASPFLASAFGQHRKFPPHARKTSGTQGSTNIEEKKEDISIVKLNISNLHKAIIYRTKRKATQNSFIYILLNQNRSLHNSRNAKIVWNGHLQFTPSGVL